MEIYAKHGLLVRRTYLILAVINWLLFGWHVRRNTTVLCYHGIRPEQKQRFERQMAKLIGGFPGVRITFDDAFENLLDNALPLLDELRIPAIVFAVPGNMGKSPQWNIASSHPEYKEKIMTAEQLKSIQNDLIKIGSHTQTHRDLSKLSGEEVRWELTESRRNLEQLLGKPVEDLALPYGAYNAEALHIAREAGYKRIYTLEPKIIKHSYDAGALGRFSMSPDVWPIEFYLTCCGAYSWLFPFRRFVKWVGRIVKGSIR